MRAAAEINALRAAAPVWASLSARGRIALLRETVARIHAAAPEWVALSVAAKGLGPHSQLHGEEWISGPWAVMYAINRYVRTLERIAAGNSPIDSRAARVVSGQARLRVFPYDMYDRVLLTGVSAEVRFTGGSVAFLQPDSAPQVALVLGAGNISSIAPLDALYGLLAHNAVCLVKLSPVNDYLKPVFENAFSAFVEAGYIRFVTGDAAASATLCADPAIARIHVTGSSATYEAVVRQASGKPVTAELGSVTPTIVVPGDWSERDLRFQAENVATQKMHNAGFNCIAAQVLIVPQSWHLQERFLREVDAVLATIEERPDYYPGAADRRAAFGAARGRTSIVRLDPNETPNAFSTEAFCAALFCVELPGDTSAFLRAAVRFANERLYGTLGANIIVDPATERSVAGDYESAISDLRYGCVAVNAWAGVGYFLTETPWGGYREETGVVHNSYFLAGIEKSVVRAPFRPLTKPPWFITNEKQNVLGKRLCDFEASRSAGKALRVIAAAML